MVALPSVATLAATSEIKTYEFVDTGERLFGIRGGIGAANLFAKVGGNFSVQLNEDGTNEIISFDAFVYDAVTANTNQASWEDGSPIENLLFKSPIGESVSLKSTGLSLSGLPSTFLTSIGFLENSVISDNPDFTIALPSGPTARISIDDTTSNLTVKITSSMGIGVLDVPSYVTNDPGLLIRAISVPEPNSILLLLSAFSITQTRCKRCKHLGN